MNDIYAQLCVSFCTSLTQKPHNQDVNKRHQMVKGVYVNKYAFVGGKEFIFNYLFPPAFS